MSKERSIKAVELVNSLIKVSIFLQKAGNQQVVNLGLNQSQFAVLGEISKNKDITQKDILGEFLLEKSNLSKIIKKLEQMQLITIKIPENDKRKTVLNSTTKGKQLYNNGMQELNKLKELFVSPLSDNELEKLLPAMKQLDDLVNFHIENNK